MQQRIEELAEGCFKYIEGTLDGDVVEFNYKLFAELIIKECVTKCKTDWYGDSLDDICIQILEHFGIKE